MSFVLPEHFQSPVGFTPLEKMQKFTSFLDATSPALNIDDASCVARLQLFTLVEFACYPERRLGPHVAHFVQ